MSGVNGLEKYRIYWSINRKSWSDYCHVHLERSFLAPLLCDQAKLREVDVIF